VKEHITRQVDLCADFIVSTAAPVPKNRRRHGVIGGVVTSQILFMKFSAKHLQHLFLQLSSCKLLLMNAITLRTDVNQGKKRPYRLNY